MKFVMKKLFFILPVILFLASCMDNNDYYYENNEVEIATVENPDNATRFYLKLDNNERLYTLDNNLKYYRPKDGQRIIANFRILTNKSDTSAYAHDIQLNDVYEILTKGIFKIKPEEQDSIGNDQIHIRDMWIGSNYLNVEFNYPGFNKIHYINLVSDSTKTYNDGKIHLEFRHNANGDYPSYSKWGMVSFNLSSLNQTTLADTLNLVIHTREYTTNENETYNLSYEIHPSMWFSPRKISFKKSTDKIE
jgi:hypothetical protein